MAVFPLKILTPDGVAFDGSVSAVSCRTINGQIQLLAKHIDYCTALGMGEAHITLEDGTIRRAACMGGMLSMIGGECRLLATTFEWADAIDKERAERSKARAGRSLPRKRGYPRMELAEARLKRALRSSSLAAESILIQPKYPPPENDLAAMFFEKFTFFEFFSKKLTFLYSQL